MKVINYSTARKNLKSILDQVSEDMDYTIITRRGAEDAVVMSFETFSSYMETIYLLKSPKNAQRLMESLNQYKGGKVKASDLIDE